MASASNVFLKERLNSALPCSAHLSIHHVASEPFACPELFPAPPNEEPEPTLCESHFLSASIRHDGAPLHVFAVEVLVYTTDTLTTLFVSKADSTGYLRHLGLPKGTSSPIKTVIATFLEYLVDVKRRKDARLVLSLFARAQNQYLFPGSVENTDKHVLDDRGLIKWWCRLVDPILHKYAPPTTSAPEQPTVKPASELSEPEYTARAHLVVPGCDNYETRAYLPRAPSLAPGVSPRWTASDPLERLGKPAGLPPRCYIPRFPDDPKARFVIDLDDELPEPAPAPAQGESAASDLQTGRWRSVRSLPQFWELMAFRQECAAGRLVGFLWVVFEPSGLKGQPLEAKADIDNVNGLLAESQKIRQLPTPECSQPIGAGRDKALGADPPSSPTLPPVPDTLLTPIPSSQPQAASQGSDHTSNMAKEPLSSTNLPLPPPERTTRADKETNWLSEPAYKRVMEVLERTDYANLEVAIGSTEAFLSSVAQETGLQGWDWGYEIVGERVEAGASAPTPSNTEESLTSIEQRNGHVLQVEAGQVQTLGAGLVRKKRPAAEASEGLNGSAQLETASSEPRILGLGVVRKKPKV